MDFLVIPPTSLNPNKGGGVIFNEGSFDLGKML